MKTLSHNVKFAGSCLLAATVSVFALTGRVIDESGQPIANVTITIQVNGWYGATNQDGLFVVSETIVKNNFLFPQSGNPMVRFSNAGLTVYNRTRAQPLRIERFSLNGRRAETLFKGTVLPGEHLFSTKGAANASGLSLLKVRFNGQNFVHKIPAVDTEQLSTPKKTVSFGTSHNSTAKMSVSPINKASVLFSKAGYLPKSLPINNMNSDLGAVMLYDTAFAATLETMPLIDGSTTTISLSRLLFAKLLGVSYRWKKPAKPLQLWEIVPDTADVPYYDAFISRTTHNKTHGSIMNVIKGHRKICLVARIPSQDELDSAKALGVSLKWRAIALDALTIIVNNDNTIAGLSTQDVRDIFSKKITNWKAVGGPDAPIRAYQRNPNSGSQEMMKTFVMKETSIEPSLPKLEGMMEVFDMLHFITYSVSFTPHYYLEVQVRDSLIHSLAIDGFIPGHENIRSRKYPFCAEVYAVTQSTLPDTAKAAKLLDWLLAPQGQAAIKESGYVSLR